MPRVGIASEAGLWGAGQGREVTSGCSNKALLA